MPRWGDYVGNRSERFLATVAYLDGVHPSAVMTRGLYSYVYLTAYDWDGENISQRWLSEHNWGGVDKDGNEYSDSFEMDKNYGEDSTIPIVKANNVVWYGNDLYNRTTRPYKTGKVTAYDQGNHSLSAADMDNDGKQEIVYGGAVIDDDGLCLFSTERGHGDAHHVSDYNNDGIIEKFSVHEQGPGVDLVQYDPSAPKKFKDIYWSGWAGWDIGRGMAGNLDDDFAYKYKIPAVFYSIMNGSLYSTADGKELDGGGRALAPNSNNVAFMDFTVLWDGDLGTELLDGLSSGAPVVANHYIGQEPDGTFSSGTGRILWTKKLNFLPDVGTNNGTKHAPSMTADILGDWREEMLFRLNDLDGNGYCDGIRMYMTCDHTEYRLPTLMHDAQYRCQVSSENVGYNQPPHTSYYIGSLALAKDDNGELLNYLDPKTGFTNVHTECFGGTATCTKKAVCKVCGKEYGELNKDNHSLTTTHKINEKTATCKEEGYTGDIQYDCCNAEKEKGKVIAKLEHKYDEGKITKQATYEEEGEKTYTCKVCNETKIEKIPKLVKEEHTKHTGGTATCIKKAVCEVCGKEYGELDKNNHSLTTTHKINEKTATCKEEGYTGDILYDCCNAEKEKGTVIAKLEHKFNDGIITKEATYEQEGEKTYSCKVCGETKTEKIPKLNKQQNDNNDNDNNNNNDNNADDNKINVDEKPNIEDKKQDNNTNKNEQQNSDDNTVVSDKLPQTGEKSKLGIWIAIFLLIIFGAYSKMKLKKK